MGFKFFGKNDDAGQLTNRINRERFFELVNARRTRNEEEVEYHRAMLEIDEMMNPTEISLIEPPAVYLRLERNRDTISDDEWNSIIQRQRSQLIELMWQQGIVMHTIISQDDNGLTLRTEVRSDILF